MANPFSIDALVANVIRMESVASSSQTFSEDDIIEFLNMELLSTVVPTIQSVNEEFAVMSIDYDAPIPATVEIPSQATGARLRSVQLITPQGYIQNIPRLDPDKIGQSTFLNSGFYIKNNSLVFYPSGLTITGSLRLNYFRRPNTLVNSLAAGRILSIDTIGNTVTLDTSPVPTADWTTGTLCDGIISTSPFDFRLRNAEIINITGTVIEFSADVIAELQVNDYIALAGQSPVAQFIPAEAVYYLCQLAGARCLQALGDTQGYQVSMQKADSMRMNLLNLISDRIESQPKKLSARGMGKKRGFNWVWW